MTRFFVRHPVTHLDDLHRLRGAGDLCAAEDRGRGDARGRSARRSPSRPAGTGPRPRRSSARSPCRSKRPCAASHGVENGHLDQPRPGRRWCRWSSGATSTSTSPGWRSTSSSASVRREPAAQRRASRRSCAFVPEEFQTEQFFTFSIESTLSPNELREQAERWIVPQVLAVDGVADAQVLGGARPLLKIILDRRKLELYGITADEVFRAVDRAGRAARRRRRPSRTGWRSWSRCASRSTLERPATMRSSPGAADVNFRLGDAGRRCEPDFEDPDYFVRTNGKQRGPGRGGQAQRREHGRGEPRPARGAARRSRQRLPVRGPSSTSTTTRARS